MTRPLAGLVRRKPALLLAGAAGGGVAMLGLLLLVGWLLFGGKKASVAATMRPAPTAAAGPEMMTNSLAMKLVLIPAGDFRMGSPSSEPDREGHEGPQHLVTISRPFWMGTFETTVAQFRAFVQATGYRTDAERDGGGSFCYAPNGDTFTDAKCVWHTPGIPQSDAHPVGCVSRADAVAFCQWLSKKENKVYRLPTEAEWEYACRAGTTTTWNTGATLEPARARFNGLQTTRNPEVLRTVKVGSYPPNAFGLHDMHGNVWEWCSDWYDESYYARSPQRDPLGPPNGERAVFRGGGFEVEAKSCRSAFRFPINLSMRHIVIGFRVVCEK